MKRRYKIASKSGMAHIQRLTIGLFGEQWETIASFDRLKCGENARQIVRLLNKCDIITQKQYDRKRDT